jgi:hypothetical protein
MPVAAFTNAFFLHGEAVSLSVARHMFILLSVLSLAACATRPAPRISGRWKAVNHYAASPQEIPLHQAYVFSPSPLDITLKTMLSRWADDSRMTLSYEHPSDFTLYGAVAQLHTTSLQEAVVELSSMYVTQHVYVTTDGNVIAVRNYAVAAIAPAPSAGRP